MLGGHVVVELDTTERRRNFVVVGVVEEVAQVGNFHFGFVLAQEDRSQSKTLDDFFVDLAASLLGVFVEFHDANRLAQLVDHVDQTSTLADRVFFLGHRSEVRDHRDHDDGFFLDQFTDQLERDTAAATAGDVHDDDVVATRLFAGNERLHERANLVHDFVGVFTGALQTRDAMDFEQVRTVVGVGAIDTDHSGVFDRLSQRLGFGFSRNVDTSTTTSPDFQIGRFRHH